MTRQAVQQARQKGPPGVLSGRRGDAAAVGLLFLLTLMFFADFVFSNKMLFGTDTIPAGYMARKFFADALAEGVFPLWNPMIVGGLPFIDALHGDALYPASLLNAWMPVHRFIGWKLVLHVFLAGVCMYAFLRTRRIGRPAALVAGIGYAFAPYLISLIYAGHDGKLYVTALLPLAFACLERGLRSRRWFDFVMMGGGIGLLLLTSHVQMSAYALWGLGLYLMVHLIRLPAGERRIAAIGGTVVRFAAGVAVGLGLGLVQFLPAYLYTSRFSPRAGGVSYEFATSWALHIEEVVSLAVPRFVHYLGDYWGRNPFKLNCEAPGAILLLLAALALGLHSVSYTHLRAHET